MVTASKLTITVTDDQRNDSNADVCISSPSPQQQAAGHPSLAGQSGGDSRCWAAALIGWPPTSSVPHWPPSLPPLTRLATAPRGLIHSVFSLSRIRIPVIVVDSVWPRRYNYNTRSGPAVEPGSRDASRDCLCPARG